MASEGEKKSSWQEKEEEQGQKATMSFGSNDLLKGRSPDMDSSGGLEDLITFEESPAKGCQDLMTPIVELVFEDLECTTCRIYEQDIFANVFSANYVQKDMSYFNTQLYRKIFTCNSRDYTGPQCQDIIVGKKVKNMEPQLQDNDNIKQYKERRLVLPTFCVIGLIREGPLFLNLLWSKLNERRQTKAYSQLTLARFEIQNYTGYNIRQCKTRVDLNLKISTFNEEIYADLRLLLYKIEKDGTVARSPIFSTNGITLRYSQMCRLLEQWQTSLQVSSSIDEESAARKFYTEFERLNPVWRKAKLSSMRRKGGEEK